MNVLYVAAFQIQNSIVGDLYLISVVKTTTFFQGFSMEHTAPNCLKLSILKYFWKLWAQSFSSLSEHEQSLFIYKCLNGKFSLK